MAMLHLVPLIVPTADPADPLAMRIREAKFSPCSTPGACTSPGLKYERIQKSQPGYQWDDNGGYCGSWAVQRAALSKGAWISQQQVRDHTSPAPGAPPSHDNEILSPNIAEALRNLKIKAEGFDFQHAPVPQQPAYFSWLKGQLVQNHTVVWMIMWDGQSYPAYNMKVPYGVHGHVEPVIGIESNHPLTDTTVYDDDTFVHYTDNGVSTVYKPVATLAGSWKPGGRAKCQSSSSYCIGPYSCETSGIRIQCVLPYTDQAHLAEPSGRVPRVLQTVGLCKASSTMWSPHHSP